MKILLLALLFISASCASKTNMNKNVATQLNGQSEREPAQYVNEDDLAISDKWISEQATIKDNAAAILFSIVRSNSRVSGEIVNGYGEQTVVATTPEGTVTCKKSVTCNASTKEVNSRCLSSSANYSCFLQRSQSAMNRIQDPIFVPSRKTR